MTRHLYICPLCPFSCESAEFYENHARYHAGALLPKISTKSAQSSVATPPKLLQPRDIKVFGVIQPGGDDY